MCCSSLPVESTAVYLPTRQCPIPSNTYEHNIIPFISLRSEYILTQALTPKPSNISAKIARPLYTLNPEATSAGAGTLR